MPRLKRRGFSRRGLNDAQRELLTMGDVLVAHHQPGFDSEAHERAAWLTHRAVLMGEDLGPGRRPAGYYKFDLKRSDLPTLREWWMELRVLIELGLCPIEEQIQVEATRCMLAGKQDESLYSSFDNPELIRQMRLGAYLLRRSVEEFQFAAEWHDRRGRPELAARYHRRADTVQAVLDDTEKEKTL